MENELEEIREIILRLYKMFERIDRIKKSININLYIKEDIYNSYFNTREKINKNLSPPQNEDPFINFLLRIRESVLNSNFENQFEVNKNNNIIFPKNKKQTEFGDSIEYYSRSNLFGYKNNNNKPYRIIFLIYYIDKKSFDIYIADFIDNKTHNDYFRNKGNRDNRYFQLIKEGNPGINNFIPINKKRYKKIAMN